jgi:hypothetical protein
MIAEAIIGSITTITCSSLWLVSTLDKRKRLADEKILRELDAELNPPAPPPPPIILPYQKLEENISCPICGIFKKDTNWGGPQHPYACPENKKCNARDASIPHLHCWCRTCKTNWLMHPKTNSGGPV